MKPIMACILMMATLKSCIPVTPTPTLPPDPTSTPTYTATPTVPEPTATPTPSPTWPPTQIPTRTPAPRPTIAPSTETDAALAGWGLFNVIYPVTADCTEAGRWNKTMLFGMTDHSGRSGWAAYWRYVTTDCRECDGSNQFSVCLKPEAGQRMPGYECIEETYICDAPALPADGSAQIGVAWSPGGGVTFGLLDSTGGLTWQQTLHPRIPVSVSRLLLPGDPLPPGWAGGWTPGATVTLVSGDVTQQGAPQWCPPPPPAPTAVPGPEGWVQGSVEFTVSGIENAPNPENGILVSLSSPDLRSCILVRLTDEPGTNRWQIRGYLCWGDGPVETHWIASSWPGPVATDGVWCAAWSPGAVRVSDPRGATITLMVPWRMAVGTVDTEEPWAAGRLGGPAGCDVTVTEIRGETRGRGTGC